MRWHGGLLILLSTCLSPLAAADARLAIIIDDIGYNLIQSQRAAQLVGDFTLAVLPFTPHGNQVAQLAHQQGKELMLHAPMSNLSNMPLGRGGLHSGMNQDQLTSTLRADLDSLPFIKGVNNHMGSQLTQDANSMRWVMAELRRRGLYFVDSRTSAQTRALEVAQAEQIPSVKRDVFLDDVQEPAAVAAQFRRALQLAQTRGSALAIGHPYEVTMNLLEHAQPLLAQAQVRLVFASQLVHSANIGAKTANSPSRQMENACPAPPLFARVSTANPTLAAELLNNSALYY